MPMPHPTKGENEHDFSKRAHESLAHEFPDSEQRSAVVFRLWREHHGESEEEKRAHSKFPDDQFHHIENVPVFKEHEYPRTARDKSGRIELDDDGNPKQTVERYGFDELKSICENLNHRIADTGDFSPITDKHNPRKGSEESKPGIVGFSGPFGLGQVGNKEPKWAIIAKKEHWFKDKAHLAREMPRRSPEVYLGRPMHQRVLDPITALGADTPALDMGIHYAQDANTGEEHAFYSGPALLARYAFDESKHKRDEGGQFAKKAHEATSEAHDHSRQISHPTKFEKFHKHAHEAMKASQEKDHHTAMVFHEMAAKQHANFAGTPEHGAAHHQAKRAHERAARAHEEADAHQYDANPKEKDSLDAAGMATYAGACFPGAMAMPAEHVSVAKKKPATSKVQYEEATPGAPSERPDRPAPPADPAHLSKQSTEHTSMISPEDANTIIHALMETEPMRFLVEMMQREKAPVNEEGEVPPESVQEPAATQEPPSAPPKEQLSEELSPEMTDKDKVGEDTTKHDGAAEPTHDGKGRPYDGATEPHKPHKVEEMEPVSVDKKEPKKYAQREAARDEVAQYAALQQKVALLEKQANEATNRVVLGERKNKLEAYRLQGFDIDVDEEMQRCSLESMNEDRFQDHLDLIVKHYKQVPINLTLITPDAPLIEDRHNAAARQAKANVGEADPALLEEVAAYAQAEMDKPEFKWSADFYKRCRDAVILKRAEASSKPAPVKVA